MRWARCFDANEMSIRLPFECDFYSNLAGAKRVVKQRPGEKSIGFWSGVTSNRMRNQLVAVEEELKGTKRLSKAFATVYIGVDNVMLIGVFWGKEGKGKMEGRGRGKTI